MPSDERVAAIARLNTPEGFVEFSRGMSLENPRLSDQERVTMTKAALIDAHEFILKLGRERDDLASSLRMLRDAWNAHMDACPQHAALPDLPAPSWEDLQRWADAPSGTASA